MFSILSLTLLLAVNLAANSCIGQTLYNTVGQECTQDADCAGPNEMCGYNITDFSPFCQMRQCQCEPCYVLDADSDEAICKPRVELTLGSNCTGGENEILPDGALCQWSTVICGEGYVDNELGGCAWKGNISLGQSCETSFDCVSPTMWCQSATATCQCFRAFIYDPSLQACRKREFGDACQEALDCDTFTNIGTWDGYTWDNGDCVNGRCDCDSTGQRANITHIDPKNGQSSDKTICVHGQGNIQATEGDDCDVNPIYSGFSPSVNVCIQGLICYKCPEDPASDVYPGTCRNFSTFQIPITTQSCNSSLAAGDTQ